MKKKIYKTETVKIQKQIIGKFTVNLLSNQNAGFDYTMPDTQTMTSSSGII